MYRLSARQILLIALITGLFAAGGVVILDRISNRFQPSHAAFTETAPAGISDPATSTDEQNNIEVYRTLSPGVVFIHSTSYARDFFGSDQRFHISSAYSALLYAIRLREWSLRRVLECK